MAKVDKECELHCPKCPTVQYQLLRKEVRPDSGIFQNVIWPKPGSDLLPPDKSSCPNCGSELTRVYPKAGS